MPGRRRAGCAAANWTKYRIGAQTGRLVITEKRLGPKREEFSLAPYAARMVSPISTSMTSNTKRNCRSRPAMTEIASGCWIAENEPIARASNIKVGIAANVVIVARCFSSVGESLFLHELEPHLAKTTLSILRCYLTRVPASPLRQEHNAKDDEHRDDSGGQRSTERKATVFHRLVKKVTDSGAEWPCQDECRPEQKHARNVRPIVKGSKHCEPGGEDQSATFIAEASSIGDPIAERGAQRLREGNRCPVERLDPRRADGIHRNSAFRPVPHGEDQHQATEQKGRAAGVADAERAVGEVGHGRAECGRGDDRRPIEEWMELLGQDSER